MLGQVPEPALFGRDSPREERDDAWDPDRLVWPLLDASADAMGSRGTRHSRRTLASEWRVMTGYCARRGVAGR